MPIAVQLDFKDGTLEQYDRVMSVMGFTSGGAGAPGGLFHWVTATNEGIRVTDVWQDRETFERFSQEHIGPSMQEAGVDIVPEIAFFDVHSYLTAG